MSWLELAAAVAGASIAVPAVVLAFVPRPRSWWVRLRWFVAGIVVGGGLTFGAAKLAEVTDGFDDLLLIGLGFWVALIALLVGHTRTPDAWAWWLGNAAVAIAWILCIAALVAFFHSIGDDF